MVNIEKLLNTIYKDIAENYGDVPIMPELLADSPESVHYSIGIFIRNKYLWKSPENIEALCTHFNVSHADSVSSKIIREYYTNKAKSSGRIN